MLSGAVVLVVNVVAEDDVTAASTIALLTHNVRLAIVLP